MMHEIYIALGSPSYISGFTLIGLVIKCIYVIYLRISISKINDEIIDLRLKVRGLEVKLKEGFKRRNK